MMDDPAIEMCTLGMFIIDEIQYAPPKPSVRDIIGGAGSYAALGARLMVAPSQSRAVGWVVDAGSDFPVHARETIESYKTSCIIREMPGRLTTRGLNSYGEGEWRDFKYLTPPSRLDHTSLPPSHLKSKAFHLICSPSRCIELVHEITTAALQAGSDFGRAAFFIWEPVPTSCRPSDFSKILEANTLVDVVSPNVDELYEIFGREKTSEVYGEDLDREQIVALCRRWIHEGIGRKRQGAVVVRAGKFGCCLSELASDSIHIENTWFPALHEPVDDLKPSPKVEDPTGGGNTFLGALALGLVRAGDVPSLEKIKDACIWGMVAASFAVEQIGLPILGRDVVTGEETWNGVRVADRMSAYTTKVRHLRELERT